MSILAQSSGGDALALAVVLAVIYMVIIRLMDLNEKEPLWAMGLVFGLGFIASMLLYLIVPTPTLELNFIVGPVIRGFVKVVAVGLAIGALEAIGRGKGWTEVDGALDGVVYGTAVGLGFATGVVFVRELVFGSALSGGLMDAAAGSELARLWPLAARGLSEGVFGGVAGIGFGLAASRRRSDRTKLIAIAAVASIVLHVLYTIMTREFATTSAGRILALLGLILPIVVIIGIIGWSLAQERRVLKTQLAEEHKSGLLSDEDMGLLTSYGKRRGAYMKRLTSGDIDGWGDLKALHNRHVQLAFAKDRAAKGDPDAPGEVERLRAAISAMQSPASAPAASVSSEGTGA